MQEIQPSNLVDFRVGVTCSYEIQYYRALWVKMKVSPNWKWLKMGSNPSTWESLHRVEHLQDNQPSKLFFEWELLI
jgi:hypothetical protein